MEYMSRLFWVLAALLIAGCGARPTASHTPQVSIDPAFQRYVDDFVADAKAQGHPVQITDLIIKFGDLGTTAPGEPGMFRYGQCDTAPDTTPVITINTNPAVTNWYGGDDAFRELVIYHEMGHCVLGLQHDTNMITLAVPSIDWQSTAAESLMHPDLEIAAQFITEFRDHYVTQLFTGKNDFMTAQSF